MEEPKEAKKAKGEKVVVSEEVQAQPEAITPVADKPPKAKNKQTVITLAIVSGVVLFFLGLGLGYMLGHAGTSSRIIPGNGTMQPPSDGGGRRFTPNSNTNNSTDDSSTDTKTQTN